MPVLTVADNQVIEMLRQLSPEAKAEAMRALLQDAHLDALLDYGESRLDCALSARGLDRRKMTLSEVEQAILDIAEGRP